MTFMRISNPLYRALIAALVCLSVWSGSSVGAQYEEGVHYQVLDPQAPLSTSGDGIEVSEYFSYGCIHCNNCDPELEEWLTSLPDDVRFERKPTAFSRTWSILARAYYALEKAEALEGNHEQLFKGIHNGGRMFKSGQDIADYLDSQSLPARVFMRAFDSQDVSRRLNRAAEDTRRSGIRAVPTMVVSGKYRVGMNQGAQRALEVAKYLLEQERALIQGQSG